MEKQRRSSSFDISNHDWTEQARTLVPCLQKPGQAALLVISTVICWGLVASASVAEEIRLLSLKQGQYSLPSLPAPLMLARQGDLKAERLQAAQEDYLARMKRRPRLHEEIWSTASGKPGEATLCVIHTLTETAGLSFLFPREKASTAKVEIFIPHGPELGPFSISLNGKELETIDPWAREKTMPEWVSLKQPAELTQGINTLTITQKSPQDLPVWIEAIRIEEE